MDWKTALQNPFFTVALPIMITFIWGIISQNKRVDDLRSHMDRGFDSVNRQFAGVDRQFDSVNRQFDSVNKRLERIEAKLDSHGERTAKLEGPALVRAE